MKKGYIGVATKRALSVAHCASFLKTNKKYAYLCMNYIIYIYAKCNLCIFPEMNLWSNPYR